MKLKFLASPLSSFRTSHGLSKAVKVESLCLAPRALCDGPAGSGPSLGVPALQSTREPPGPLLLRSRLECAVGLTL